MEHNHLETQLANFNITDSAIAELKQKYCLLQIKGINDIQGYKDVKAARITMKNFRIDIDKRRKELTEESRKTVSAINEAAKIVTAKIVPIENYLAEQEKEYEAEKERIKKEKEEADALVLQDRTKKLFELGFQFNGVHYKSVYSERVITNLELKTMPAPLFENLLISIAMLAQKAIEKQLAEAAIAKEKKEREEAELKVERDRLTQQRREQEMENERLADIAHEQAKREKQLQSEEKRISDEKFEAEKQKVIEEFSALPEKEKVQVNEISTKISEAFGISPNMLDDNHKKNGAAIREEFTSHEISNVLSDINPEFKTSLNEILEHKDAKVTLTMGDGRQVSVKPLVMKNALNRNFVERSILIHEKYIRNVAKNIELSDSKIIEILDYLEETIDDHIDIMIERVINLKTML